MNKIISLFIMLMLIVFQACDPARVLIVKTSNKSNHSITIYANENILPFSVSYHQDSITQKTIIHVPTTDTVPKYEKIFFYGIGCWDDH